MRHLTRCASRQGWLAAALVVSTSFVSTGCAVVEDHNDNFLPFKKAMDSGQFATALEHEDVKNGLTNKLDGLCYQLDSGVVAYLAGDYGRSKSFFEKANATMGFHEDRGVTVGSVTEQAGSMLLNEKTIPYKGEGFEKILVSAYQAKNYLFDGDLEGAMVEVRACYEKQKFVKDEYEKELDAVEDKKKDEEFTSAATKVGLNYDEAYAKANAGVSYPTLSSLESIYQLAYVEYLCQLIAERKNEWQDARISIEKIIAIRPDVAELKQDYLRLSALARSYDLVKEGEKKWGLKAPPTDTGSVAVLFEQGWAPHKEEFSFVFPIRTGIAKFALPLYKRSEQCKDCDKDTKRNGGENAGARVRLVLGNQQFESYMLTDLSAVAMRYHKDRMPVLIAKAIIRTVIKIAAAEATHEGVKHGVGKDSGLGVAAGFLAGAAVSVAGAVTEQADLRAWLSLPASYQVARGYVPQGEYPARLELLSSAGSVVGTQDLGTIKVKRGQVRFVDVRSLGSKMYVRSRKEAWDDQPMAAAPAPSGGTTSLLKPDAPPAKKPETATPPTKIEKPLKPDAPPAKKPETPTPPDKTEKPLKPDAPAKKPETATPPTKTDKPLKPDAPKPEPKKPEPKRPSARPEPKRPEPKKPEPKKPEEPKTPEPADEDQGGKGGDGLFNDVDKAGKKDDKQPKPEEGMGEGADEEDPLAPKKDKKKGDDE